MNQTPLFFDDINAAMAHVVNVLGGAKRVGPMLRGDDMTVDAAARWVLDCLNTDRPAQFHPHQVLVLMREARRMGDHTAMNWLAGECGYQAMPVEPEDEAAALKRQYIESAQMMAKIANRIERLESGPAMRAVG